MRRASYRLFNLSPVQRAVLCWVGLCGWGVDHAALAQGSRDTATAQDQPGLALKANQMLSETPPTLPKPTQSPKSLIPTPAQDDRPPTFIFADRVSGRTDLETVLDGSAELRRGGKALHADRIEFYQPTDTLNARGSVRVSSEGNSFKGAELTLKLDTFEGVFEQPSYRFLANGGTGVARRIDFVSDKSLIARDASFSTCERDDDTTWKPAWVITASSFKFDQDAEIGVATGAVLRFLDVPILAVPSISFPLSDKRKSGFLPPTFNVDSVSGVMVEQPYYFNIAPNRDATLTPIVMSKRGIGLGGEYRFLERDDTGRIRANYLPSDRLRSMDRWSYSLQQTGVVKTTWPTLGNVGFGLNLNRVSDNDYWRDFQRNTTSLTNLTQRLLASDVTANWSRGYFSSSLRTLRWQTLQDPLSPIVPPYDRLPQLTAAYSRTNATVAGQTGLDWSVSGDFTRFSADRNLTLQPNASRAVAVAKLSRPWLTPGWYVTPKVQLHATSYRLDAPLLNADTTVSRVLPTFSLDSGLQFERRANYFGRGITQTLEPRAFYVRTPYRDQSALPNYDSGSNDFNFATVFTENAFVGNDRIADANLLTLGATSRLLDPDTGAEAARFGVAQRLRFSDQRVALPGGLPVSERLSDILFGTTINWQPQWAFDATVQYNPKLELSERSTFGVRYNPSHYRVVSAALRRQRGISNSVDVGWQWPVNDLWGDKGQELGAGRGQGGGRTYAVGRVNYSFQDKKLVDGILGFEYDGCCWVGRVVVQRSQNTLAASTSRILFQLELVGFSRLGVNPLQVLKTNIPRYELLRDSVTAPSRFTNYD